MNKQRALQFIVEASCTNCLLWYEHDIKEVVIEGEVIEAFLFRVIYIFQGHRTRNKCTRDFLNISTENETLFFVECH